MENALSERAPSTPTAEVTTLILDNTKLRSISTEESGLLAIYENLQHLACNRTGLKDLKNFPHLPSLRVLELTDNHLSQNSNLDSILQCEALERLLLAGNVFSSCEDLRPLASLPSLKTLDLKLNPLTTQDPHYRTTLFNTIPSLRVIDSVDREGNALESDDDGDDDEDDDEGTDSEDERAENRQLIKNFYEKDIENDESDGGDFSPPPSEPSEDDAGVDSKSDDDDPTEEASGKRSQPAKSATDAAPPKKQRSDDD